MAPEIVNLKDLKAQLGGEFTTTVLALATIKTVVRNEETKEYQGVYNKAFLPAYNLKQFRLMDYNRKNQNKKPKNRHPCFHWNPYRTAPALLAMLFHIKIQMHS